MLESHTIMKNRLHQTKQQVMCGFLHTGYRECPCGLASPTRGHYCLHPHSRVLLSMIAQAAVMTDRYHLSHGPSIFSPQAMPRHGMRKHGSQPGWMQRVVGSDARSAPAVPPCTAHGQKKLAKKKLAKEDMINKKRHRHRHPQPPTPCPKTACAKLWKTKTQNDTQTL